MDTNKGINELNAEVVLQLSVQNIQYWYRWDGLVFVRYRYYFRVR